MPNLQALDYNGLDRKIDGPQALKVIIQAS